MHICFYIHPFRDRDFWPIARTALAAGHDIYYEYAGRAPVEEVLAEDRRRPFDLLVSADRVSVDETGRYLNTRFQNNPPLLEIIFNGLIEIASNYRGPNGGFKQLEEHRVTLGVMDPRLLTACRSIGAQCTLYVPY